MDDLGAVDGPVLLFGGPYGNLQATTALLSQAGRLEIPPERVICTGDVVAYCADPQATVAAIRDAGIHVVMGNCEESLGYDDDDCGCGFAESSECDILARQWFAYARTALDPGAKAWMRRLPRRLELSLGGRRLAVVHGGARRINRFVFASTPGPEKAADIDALHVDGIIGGHAGLPFTQMIGQALWHNPGAIGLPANDGTPSGWYSVLSPEADMIRVDHHRLEYDHRRAARRIAETGLPAVYGRCLMDGLWPSMDVLPGVERAARGRPLAPPVYLWPDPRRTAAE